MTSVQSPPTGPAPSGGFGAAVAGLYRLLLRQQLTKGRLALAGAMAGLSLFLAVLIARSDGVSDPSRETVEFLSVFGLGLMVPILCLVLASSVLGQLVEDETLVYLWIRPTPRSVLAVAAWLASATIAVPVSVVSLAASAAIGSGGDQRATLAVALAMALGAIAYTALFTLLGLIVRRALIWGLLYVFIWELFVARVGLGAARLSINSYPTSVLAKLTDLTLPEADRALGTGIVVPIVVALVAIALTAWRLDNTNVA